MGRALDSVALFAWLPLCAVIFATKKPHQAALWVLLAGMLYLPERAVILVPVFPNLDKDLLPPLAILLFSALFGKQLLRYGKLDGVSKLLIVALIGTNVARAFLNPDPIIVNGYFAAASISKHTAITFILTDVISYVVPFVVGIALAHRRDWFIDSTRMWLWFAVVYGVLIMFEARFSPQLHRWIYGYLQHSFLQLMRGGGFRPIVFMNHALEVALYAATSAILALTLYRRKVRSVPRLGLFAAYLCLMPILCKSSASIIYLLIGGTVIFFLKPRLQIYLAAFLGVLVILMPLIHLSGAFPSEEIIDYAKRLTNDERAASLAYRFKNDDDLVRQTLQRPYFGWGGFSRGWVYNDDGTSWTVVDGAWIIALNDRGILGYLAHFGLFLWPLFKALRAFKRGVTLEARGLIAGIALILGFVSFDLLMNGMFNPFAFFFAGVLLGMLRAPWIYANAGPPGGVGVGYVPARPSHAPLPRLASASRPAPS